MDNPMKTSQTRSRPLPSNEELLSQIRLLLGSPEDDLQAAIMKELLAGTLRLHDSHLDVLDLKIVNRAVKELRHAFRVFHDYRDRRKISIFGSARTASDDPNYQMAFQFSRQIVDEGFEILTLAQTGKSDPQPIVCLQAPGCDYWDDWYAFVTRQLLARQLINPEDLSLFKIATSVDDAIDEIRSFYRRFHSIRYVGRLLAMRLQTHISPEQVAGLHETFGDLLSEGTFELRGPLPEELDEPDLRALPRC